MKKLRRWAMWLLIIDFVLWVISMILGLVVLQMEDKSALALIMLAWGGLADLGIIALCFAFGGYWTEIREWCARNFSG